MKKLLSLLISGVLILCLAACSGEVSQEEYDKALAEIESLNKVNERQMKEILELSNQVTENNLKSILAESVASSMGQNVIGGKIGQGYSYVIIPLTDITDKSIADMYQKIITEAQVVQMLLQSGDYDEDCTDFSFKVVDSTAKEIFEATYHTQTDDFDLSIGTDYLGQVSAAILK